MVSRYTREAPAPRLYTGPVRIRGDAPLGAVREFDRQPDARGWCRKDGNPLISRSGREI
jgi:hypothetical protein